MLNSPFLGYNYKNAKRTLYIFLTLLTVLMIFGMLVLPNQPTESLNAAFILAIGITIGYALMFVGETFVKDSIEIERIDPATCHTAFNALNNIFLAVGLAITLFIALVTTQNPMTAAISYGCFYLGLGIWSLGQSTRTANPQGLVTYPWISRYFVFISCLMVGLILLLNTLGGATMANGGLPTMTLHNAILVGLFFTGYNLLIAFVSNRHE